MQGLYVQVVNETLSTLYLTRLIGFLAISTNPQHAFISRIPEKKMRKLCHRALNFHKHGKLDRFKRFLQEIAARKNSVNQAKSAYMQKLDP